MLTEKVNRLIEYVELHKRDFFYSGNHKLIGYLSEQKLSSDEFVDFATELLGKGLFAWYDAICHCILRVDNYSAKFVNLLQSIISKIHNDMAQGKFIDTLIQLGQKEKYFELYYELIKSPPDSVVYHYAGLLLGGRGRKESIEIINYVQRKFNTHSTVEKELLEKAALINAVRLFINESYEDNVSFFNMLLEDGSTSENVPIQTQTVRLAFDMYKFDEKRTNAALWRLLKTASEDVLAIIANMLWLQGLDDIKKEIPFFIELVSKTKNSVVTETCFFYIAEKNKKVLDELDKGTLFVCFTDLLKKERNQPASESYAMEMMGKTDVRFYREKILEYVEREKDYKHLMMEFSFLIDDFYKQVNIDSKEKEQAISEIKKVISERISILTGFNYDLD